MKIFTVAFRRFCSVFRNMFLVAKGKIVKPSYTIDNLATDILDYLEKGGYEFENFVHNNYMLNVSLDYAVGRQDVESYDYSKPFYRDTIYHYIDLYKKYERYIWPTLPSVKRRHLLLKARNLHLQLEYDILTLRLLDDRPTWEIYHRLDIERLYTITFATAVQYALYESMVQMEKYGKILDDPLVLPSHCYERPVLTTLL